MGFANSNKEKWLEVKYCLLDLLDAKLSLCHHCVMLSCHSKSYPYSITKDKKVQR